jgi:hypothetical protein
MTVGIAVVLGGAVGAFDELSRASQIQPVRYLVAVNDAACHYPGKLDAFVTLHPEKLSGWLGARRTAGLPEPATVIAHTAAPLVTEVVDYQFPGQTGSGSSGLFAAKIALERTALPVVLCGVPMQSERAHFFCEAPWDQVTQFRDAWVAMKPRLARVRSMSGWTASLLGEFGA